MWRIESIAPFILNLYDRLDKRSASLHASFLEGQKKTPVNIKFEAAWTPTTDGEGCRARPNSPPRTVSGNNILS